MFIFINIGTDKYVTPAKHPNTSLQQKSSSTSEMLDIAGIQNKIELSMSSKVNQVLGEHFTPQAGKWDGEGNLADYFKLVEESAQKATTLRRKLVVGAVSSFKKEKLAPFFPVLKDKEKGGGK